MPNRRTRTPPRRPQDDDRARPGSGPGSAGGSDLSEEARLGAGLSRRRDPGDAVPPGVAPEAPAPLTEEDRRVLERLKELPERAKR